MVTHGGRTGGTGSCPPGWNGWHRARRRTASQLPRPAPCAVIAWTAYALQDGAKRQRGPSSGLSQRRYADTSPSSSRAGSPGGRTAGDTRPADGTVAAPVTTPVPGASACSCAACPWAACPCAARRARGVVALPAGRRRDLRPAQHCWPNLPTPRRARRPCSRPAAATGGRAAGAAAVARPSSAPPTRRPPCSRPARPARSRPGRRSRHRRHCHPGAGRARSPADGRTADRAARPR